MGLVGTIIGTLGTAFLSGRAQQQQYEAAAEQARTNANLQAQEAEIAAQNALKANKNAEEMARVNAQNVEDERRKQLLYINRQKANIGKSGIALTGSAASLVEQSRDEIDYESAMRLSNGQQDVYKMFGQGTDFQNQSNRNKWQESVYRKNASDYESAGNRAFWNSMLGGVFSLAGNLYSSKSSAAQEASGNINKGGVLGNYRDGYQLSNYASGAGSWGASMNGYSWNNAYSKLPKYAQPQTFF